ncbi:hypothetical protein GPAL_4022 [Glaciecola pallidula DSM 14239 = ACAM 615]|uniref:Uncharacterized protein n=1 Tax=Brumicola pallidula DSM 14239 = ACAM 615 TaxID=1121922 RepID=K6Z3S8_9ALTE|nr:hypothetical protein GPAL_4022 [Glaciecola pallidula DSM 14239 = ACAM 615]
MRLFLIVSTASFSHEAAMNGLRITSFMTMKFDFLPKG